MTNILIILPKNTDQRVQSMLRMVKDEREIEDNCEVSIVNYQLSQIDNIKNMINSNNLIVVPYIPGDVEMFFNLGLSTASNKKILILFTMDNSDMPIEYGYHLSDTNQKLITILSLIINPLLNDNVNRIWIELGKLIVEDYEYIFDKKVACRSDEEFVAFMEFENHPLKMNRSQLEELVLTNYIINESRSDIWRYISLSFNDKIKRREERRMLNINIQSIGTANFYERK